ncbi:ATP-binding protein [Dyadobacter sandarakinus]|uniref:histidine kinase n=1 Tax=Dyadobacter sandarakinus TaxID=2747268 RepID=A0ABX7I9L9_9BACT|nr:ATP-binding protein [Dyadobacter sandarakinus]QRR02127.1 GAF domain-containing protein [Dyadobacter sandarakinus]
MNIRNIVNREIVNLTNCESEPIHIPGSIQPHGFLLGVTQPDYLIEYCSQNTADYTALPPEQVLGKRLSEIFTDELAGQFHAYATAEIDTAKPFVFEINDTPFNTTVHKSGNTFILELEPFPDGTLNLPNLYNQTRKFVSIMEKSSYLLDLCQDIATETRYITGYDRVMIYRFDDDYNGEVIAESRREDLNSFSGQKYPHSDIPVQARELYIRNQLRMIADIHYEPVPLLALDQAGNKSNQSLDLSLSILRSVSPIHIEYMKNMGVGATLTISLLQNQKLWGLIACHHYSPKVLPHYTRLSALLQGHFLTSQIAVREVSEEFEVGQHVDKALVSSLELLHQHEDFIGACHISPLLLELANATGMAIYYNRRLYTSGAVPPEDELLALVHFLGEEYRAESLETDFLASVYDRENLSRHAAGIIYHRILSGTSNAILWFRNEQIETINWAGNPDKAILQNEDGFRLSPRKSFELWREVVKGKSRKWKKSELNAASSFSYALQRHINFQVIRRQEDRNRILNEELKTANKELANLNWISTHDLKEPLRKIQIFASKVLDREDPDLSLQVKDSVERMRFAAEKMQLLIEDILSYSKAGNMEKSFEVKDLNIILENVLTEMADEIREKQVTVEADRLPELQVIPFQIHQLFVNLLGNAIKFSKAGVAPSVKIRLLSVTGSDAGTEKIQQDGLYYRITFEDNGIGFEKEYETRIFDIFQRLNPAHKYPGTGIGLAICKKIMENHRGYIKAEGQLEQGAIFSLYFPVA